MWSVDLDRGAEERKRGDLESRIARRRQSTRTGTVYILLLFVRIMGALMAKMMAPLHNMPYTVCNVHKPIYIIYKSFLWLWLIIALSTCRLSIGDCCEPATQP